MSKSEDWQEIETLRAAVARRIPVGDFAERIERLADSADERTQVQALKVVADVLEKDEKAIETRLAEFVRLGLRYADTIGEIEAACIVAGIKKTNAPDYVRQLARSEGLDLPHIRKQREQDAKIRLAAELPAEDALFDEMRTMLVAQMRTGTPKERIAAAQELNRMHEFSSEGYHQARATRKAGELTPDQIAAKFKAAITGAAE